LIIIYDHQLTRDNAELKVRWWSFC